MNANGKQPDPVPQWLVERLAAGDLPPERAAAIRDRLAREPGGPARLEEVGASNAATLAAHPPADIAAAVRRRVAAADARVAARGAPGRRLFLVGAPLLAAAMGAALWLRPAIPGGGDQGGERGGGDERLKGPAPLGLRVYRKAGKQPEPLKDGDRARAGDELQLAYTAGDKRFGAVLSLDGADKVTFHLPDEGGPAAPLRTGGLVTLPQAYQLDAAPRFERFFLIASGAPFDTTSLPAVVRGAARPPAGAEIVTLTVRKE